MRPSSNLFKFPRHANTLYSNSSASTRCWYSRRVLGGSLHRHSMATAAPPIMTDSHPAKGPTAMVFMNMGGPSTTDEVGNFLSRLFV